jgi:hypothetical protein
LGSACGGVKVDGAIRLLTVAVVGDRALEVVEQEVEAVVEPAITDLIGERVDRVIIIVTVKAVPFIDTLAVCESVSVEVNLVVWAAGGRPGLYQHIRSGRIIITVSIVAIAVVVLAIAFLVCVWVDRVISIIAVIVPTNASPISRACAHACADSRYAADYPSGVHADRRAVFAVAAGAEALVNIVSEQLWIGRRTLPIDGDAIIFAVHIAV